MQINRETLLRTLESVSAGLATQAKALVAQSSSYVFRDGKVYTFNEEILCSSDSPFKIDGCVKAKEFRELIQSLPDEDLEMDVIDGNKITIRGNGKGKRKMKFAMDERLPENEDPANVVDTPQKWTPLSSDFLAGVDFVKDCVLDDNAAKSKPNLLILTFIHIHPEYVESCDESQIAHFPTKTGVEREVVIRGSSLAKISGRNFTHIGETDSWIHFKNQETGQSVSIRRFLDDYPDLSGHLQELQGMSKFTLPGGLEEVIKRAALCAQSDVAGNHITVDLRSDGMIVEGTGLYGEFKELKDLVYKGTPLRFRIDPKILTKVVKTTSDCDVIGEGSGEDWVGRIRIKTAKFTYIACTIPARNPAA